MSKVITNRWILLAGGLLLSGVSVAGVRQAYEAPNEPIAQAPDPSKLSNEDTTVRSHEMSAQMAKTEARVAALQKRAAAKRDMVMVNCTADKLVQVRGYNAVGNQAAESVQVAITNHDDNARSHNFERQSIVYQKVLVLGTEAEGCVGEDVSYIGDTQVEVDIDPAIPQDDPTIPPAAVDPTPGRFPEATPFA